MPKPIPFLDALVEAVKSAGNYNKNDQTPPAAVLWTDKERQWEPLIPLLRQRLPMLTLGKYSPTERTGPAYWLRCMIARTLKEDMLPENETPVIYLPGVSKQEMRAVEDCPKALQPLAELQYRGVLWTQKNGRDWTIAAFFQSVDGGLGIPVGADKATKEAMRRAVLRLADEPLDRLIKESPLQAPFFDSLLNPDAAQSILIWLNTPAEFKKRCGEETWQSFRSMCQAKYGFDPEKDGELKGAELLGSNDGMWNTVWRRFAESPASYSSIPEVLRRARPRKTLPLFDHPESWPQDNEAAESQLRTSLLEVRDKHASEVREAIASLEKEHGPRRAWVWAAIGWSPLAKALQHLASLAKETEHLTGGSSVAEIAEAYSSWGWKADAAVLAALAAVEKPEDIAAVKASIAVLYRPWLEEAATAMQKAVAAGDTSQTYPMKAIAPPEKGTCLLFSDGLRFDVGKYLADELRNRGFECNVDWLLAPLPGITATAKPAVSPVAGLLSKGAGFETVVSATGARVTAEVLRNLLGDAGYQVLRNDDLGDPSGRAWTELGDIDSYAHEYGWKVAYHIPVEIRSLALRVDSLLNHGWKQVTVITDHGWLMLPGGLPKAELPEHLTEVRKGRCARLKEFSNTDEQCVHWHWDHGVRVAVAGGTRCYEAGRECDHGGLSPQECVVPTIVVTRQATPSGQVIAIQNIAWKGLRLSVAVAGATEGMMVDIRTKAGDPATSLASAPRLLNLDGTASILVEDEDQLGQAAFVVVLAPDQTLSAQTLTIVGG